MTSKEVGEKLVALCNQGKFDDAMEKLYDPNIVSVEAGSMGNIPREMKGIGPVREKAKWWNDNHEIHSSKTEGPFPHDDRFAVRFQFDVTQKGTGQRHK